MALHIQYDFVRLKSGKWSKSAKFIGIYRYTELDRCEACSRLDGGVKRWWYQRYPRYMREAYPHEPVLCIGCFNKIRPLWRADRDAHELAALARKLEREIAHAKRHANGGRDAGLSVGDDGGRPQRER